VEGRGAHFLVDRALVSSLVRAARLGPDDLAVDLGAGTGALTGPLLATGARVLAVERDPRLVRVLASRFPAARVVAADLRDVPLPRRAYTVVANPPFGVTGALLARLLDEPASGLTRAELVLQLGVARQLTGTPRGRRDAWRAVRFSIRLVRRVPPAAFRPAPRVQAAHVSLVRRAVPAAAERLVAAAWSDRRTPARRALTGLAPASVLGAVWSAHDLPRTALAADVPPGAWLDLAAATTRRPARARRARPG
jgi:23S rRNA (adenine-N6)-dimethyltransferase